MKTRTILELAHTAILETKHLCPRGAKTHFGDAIREGGGDYRKGSIRLKQEIDAMRGRIKEKASSGVAPFEKIVKGEVRTTGAGNCGEQSWVAYEILARHTELRLHILGHTHWNHMDLVLCADIRDVQDTDRVNIDAAPQWGAKAVICDPWCSLAYPVRSDWVEGWKPIISIVFAGRSPRTETEVRRAR